MSDRKSSHDDYLAHRAALDSFELAISERYDRAVLTVATGALALSITLLGKVADPPKLYTIWILSTGWLLLIASIIGSLTSLLTSQSAIRHVRNQLDEQQRSEAPPEDSNPYAQWTNALNIAVLVTLVVGIALLCWFTIANMKWA